VPGARRAMQHEAPVRLDRTTEVHWQVSELVMLEGDVDALEQGSQAHVGGAIDDHPHGAVLVVLGNVGEGARKVLIGHGRHGNQKMIGEVDGRRNHGRYFKPRCPIVAATFGACLRPLLPCHLSCRP
jgi:hypothetical protein